MSRSSRSLSVSSPRISRANPRMMNAVKTIQIVTEVEGMAQAAAKARILLGWKPDQDWSGVSTTGAAR